MKYLLAIVLVAALGAAAPGFAESGDPLARLVRYVGIDTVNPPGNEARGVAFFREIFDAAGIACETAESAPGRGNIWARLRGGDAPALVLLHHMDVVPASAESWTTDPFTAVERDGRLYGRGTLDTKALGIAHLEAFLALHASGASLERDVVFVATADEEAGGLLGAGWLLEHHGGVFANAGLLLNEGGIGVVNGDDTVFRIEVAQKRPYWIRLVAADAPGHASRPNPTSAPARLVAALQRIHSAPFAPRVTPPVRAMFAALAKRETAPWRAAFLAIDEAIRDPAFLARLHEEKPGLHALLGNTCAITVLSASDKINVVPPTASAEIDCRLLPDEDAAEFRRALVERIGDPNVSVEEMMTFGPAQSDTDTALYRVLARVSREYYPGAGIVASVAGGFTDSHFFRERGITSYGYAPFVVTEAALGGVHGNNEYIPVATFTRGVAMMKDIVRALAVAGPD